MEERIITTTEDFVEEVIRTDSVKTSNKGLVAIAVLGVASLIGGGFALYKTLKAKKAETEEVIDEEEEIVEDEDCFEE